jgi:hypothetical protein
MQVAGRTHTHAGIEKSCLSMPDVLIDRHLLSSYTRAFFRKNLPSAGLWLGWLIAKQDRAYSF